MSKTPRTLEMISLAFGEDGKGDDYIAYVRAMTLCKQLENELADMREMFREYVKADNLWDILLTEGADAYEEALAKYHKLRKQAKEVLGL